MSSNQPLNTFAIATCMELYMEPDTEEPRRTAGALSQSGYFRRSGSPMPPAAVVEANGLLERAERPLGVAVLALATHGLARSLKYPAVRARRRHRTVAPLGLRFRLLFLRGHRLPSVPAV